MVHSDVPTRKKPGPDAARPPGRKPSTSTAGGLRLGLCCQFAEQPIKFRTTTATALVRLDRAAQREKLAEIIRHNAAALEDALTYCAAHGIGCFRITSQILPLKTHPLVGYAMEQLPSGADLVERFRRVGQMAQRWDIRLSFHPDQFVVLNSPRPEVVENSLAELEYQSEVAEWVGADVINLHGGGAYGDKPSALAALERNLDRLSARANTTDAGER